MSDIIKMVTEKMQKTVDALERELATMKAGRANPSMLDKIMVEYYGNMTPLNQMANISVPEARVLLIQPWDKGSMKNIEKAILMSDLGINPSNDGVVIRLQIPELTEETRKKLVKSVKKTGEESKVTIRSLRRDANDKVKQMKKDSDLSEDAAKDLEENIQKETDKYIKEIDKVVNKKENDLLSI